MTPITLVLVFALNFALTYLLTPRVARAMRGLGIVGVDVHKLGKPEIPEMCGLSLWPSAALTLLALLLLDKESARPTLAFLLTLLIAGGIGVIDDLRPLSPRLKPLMTAAAGLPILLLGTYSPAPVLPFIGATRLTIVYPFLVVLGVAVTSNAVNMMDVLNGVMPATCGIVALTASAALIHLGRASEAAYPLILLGGLAAFYMYNKYPARVFSGDSGSLFVGAGLGAVAILGRIEIVMIVAMMPHIMNAYYGLSSIGRLYERREVAERPTEVLPDGRLSATSYRTAPLTLTRLILAQGPLSEREVVRIITYLTALSCALAALTLLVIPGMV